MTDSIVIITLAIIVCGLVSAFWFIRVKMDGRKMREKMHRRRVEDAERKELFWPQPELGPDALRDISERRCKCALHPVDDDSTVTLPVIEEP